MQAEEMRKEGNAGRRKCRQSKIQAKEMRPEGNAGREKCKRWECWQRKIQAGGIQAGGNTGRGKRRHGEVQTGDRQHEEHANVHICRFRIMEAHSEAMETHSGVGESRLEATGAHY